MMQAALSNDCFDEEGGAMLHPRAIKSGRSTKIIATLGPSTQDRNSLYGLIEAGVDVFRLNFSHGTHDDHRKTIYLIREIEAALGRPIALFADLQGPKLRIGVVEDNTHLSKGQGFRLLLDEVTGNEDRVTLAHPEIFEAAKVGSKLLLDDGRVVLSIKEVHENEILTEVLVGGRLSSRKGVNVPDITLPIGAITQKDRADFIFALKQEIKIFALSFVQRVEDIAELRKLTDQNISVISKLEKPAALKDLEGIVLASDAIMVARGDLGVELSPDQVPIAQRKIVERCRNSGTPVIVATQMLESMITAPTPTRAEASDVANAVYQQADAVMLSAETAAGEFPIEAVSVMNDVIHRVETDIIENRLLEKTSESDLVEKAVPFAMGKAVKELSQALKSNNIACFTTSGSTAVSIARDRPEAHILGLTANADTARFLNLVWGVNSQLSNDASNFLDMVSITQQTMLDNAIGEKGDHVIITAGVPFGTPGGTNLIRVEIL